MALAVGFLSRMGKAQGKQLFGSQSSSRVPPPTPLALTASPGGLTAAFSFLSSLKDGFVVVSWQEEKHH